MFVSESMEKSSLISSYVEQAWCGIYGMAPTIQAQHVVAVTIPTIAVIFLTYLWYKKRSNSVTRGKNDPGGGGGTSRKRTRHRNNISTMPSVTVATCNTEQEIFPVVIKNAMQKAIRDMETTFPIEEINSDYEENEGGVDDNIYKDKISNINNNFEINMNNKNNNVEASSIEENNNDSEKFVENYSKIDADSDKIENQDEKVLNENENEENCNIVVTNENILKTPIVEDQSVSKNENETLLSETVNENDEQCISVNDKNIRTDDNSYFCAVSHQEFNCKNTVKTCQENSANSTINANLDMTMQKLENIRLEDKLKRKFNTSQRQNHLIEDVSNLTSVGADNCSNQSVKPKSSSMNINLQLTSSSSKSRKRKSKKKSKHQTVEHHVCDNACKIEDEITSKVTMTSTCDSLKTFDPCTRTRKHTKSTFNVCGGENEKIYRNSQEDHGISRCNLKKSDNCDLKIVEHHQKDCDNERDSANHSPVDTILDSQSVQFSDAHSEGSSDSGKGCSEGAASPTPQTPAGGSSISGDQNMILLYQFVIPQEHVGKLIGKHGQFINQIKLNSNTRIYIKKHPTSFKKKVCALEGTQQEINKALELIRNRFPEEMYQDVTLEEFPVSIPIACPLRPELFQLDLVEGVNNDVVISSLVNAGHLFLQQPMHPTYQSLTLLNLSMNQVYSCPEAPIVLKPLKDNIVAAPAMDGWYRAQIVSVHEETETCNVRFLDYGGYLTLNTSCLRAVRADFLTLPFQAVECFLANIAPINDTWCEDAKLVVQGLTYGQILQAQVYDYTPEGIPLILLYTVHGSQVILINQELVARGYAYTTLSSESVQSDDYYVY